MKQITLHIPNNKYAHFIELAKSIKYVKKIDEAEIDGEYIPLTKKHVLEGLKKAVKEMNLVNKGKLKARDAMELLNEI